MCIKVSSWVSAYFDFRKLWGQDRYFIGPKPFLELLVTIFIFPMLSNQLHCYLYISIRQVYFFPPHLVNDKQRKHGHHGEDVYQQSQDKVTVLTPGYVVRQIIIEADC